MSESSRVGVTGVTSGAAPVVFLSPILTDHRVWGGVPQTVTEQVGSGIGAVVCSWPVQPEEGFDSVAIVEAALEEHGLGRSVGPLAAVVATGDDAAVAVRLARRGRARALVLIRPMLSRYPEDFDLDFDGGDEIGPPPEEYLDALGAAMAAGDPAAYAELQVRFLAPTVTGELAVTLRSMFADTFAALSLPLRWVPHPGVWLEDIASLDVPVLLLAPPFGGSAALSARVAQLADDAAPRAELVTYADDSELPWLSAPAQLVGPMVRFLARR